MADRFSQEASPPLVLVAIWGNKGTWKKNYSCLKCLYNEAAEDVRKFKIFARLVFYLKSVVTGPVWYRKRHQLNITHFYLSFKCSSFIKFAQPLRQINNKILEMLVYGASPTKVTFLSYLSLYFLQNQESLWVGCWKSDTLDKSPAAPISYSSLQPSQN